MESATAAASTELDRDFDSFISRLPESVTRECEEPFSLKEALSGMGMANLTPATPMTAQMVLRLLLCFIVKRFEASVTPTEVADLLKRRAIGSSCNLNNFLNEDLTLADFCKRSGIPLHERLPVVRMLRGHFNALTRISGSSL